MDTSKYKELFITEAEEQIATLSRLLLLIEKAPGTKEQYAECMRSAHTIKGAAATMGYKNAAELAHALEDVFHAAEREAISLTSETVSLALSALDELTNALTQIKERDEDVPREELVARLRGVLAGETPTPRPSGQHMNNPTNLTQTQTTGSDTKTAQVPYAAPEHVRVGIEHLDSLMGLFEELLMLRLKLDSLLEPAHEMMKTIDNPLLKQRLFFVDEFKSLFADMARLLSETQDELLRIRLVPLDQLFGQFPRMMRDAVLSAGKEVAFTVNGGDTELDRSIIGGLGGALTHLLRNAISHGIEHFGRVTLNAFREKDRVHIVVEDDGSGIMYDRVREVAIERGLVSEGDARRLSNSDLNDLLFFPEMSTERSVSLLSGRGVGLFAVKTFAQEAGGSVSVVSPVTEKGGTRFTIDLPVSLATVKVLLVQSRRFIFALPFRSIERTVLFHAKDIVHAAHQDEVVFEGGTIPLLSLERLFSSGGATHKESAPEDEVTMILLYDDRGKIGLIVEKIVGERELLVKSLPPILRDLESFSGSALLPDGRTVLVLDVHGLLTHTLNVILEDTTRGNAPKLQ